MLFRINNRTVIILLLGIAVFGSCTSPETRSQKLAASPAASVENSLLQADDVLHQQLQAVQQADDAYAQLLAHRTTTKELDDRDGRIVQAEITLQQTVDSLEQHSTLNNEGKERLLRLTAYYKSALQNRRAASDMRMVLSANSDDSTAAQQMVLRLRADVQERDKRIAALEQQTRQNSNAVALLQNPPSGKQTDNYAPARGEGAADMKQRNKNLSLALGNLQTKYFVLGRNYLVLKQEHDRTVTELAALRKSGNPK